MDEIDIIDRNPPDAPAAADEATIPGGDAKETITTAVVTIEEQVAQLYQRQNEQSQLLAELRARVLELEGVVLEMKQAAGAGGIAERKRSNGDSNPPPTITTISQISHPIDHPASSSILIDSLVHTTTTANEPMLSTITTDDDDISTILASRQERNLWPLKRKYCSSFSRELDLMKLRFHNSNMYPHKTVRIPKQQHPSSLAAVATIPTMPSSSEVASTFEVGTFSTTTAISSTSSQTEGGNKVAVGSSGNNNNYYGSLGNKEGRLICRLCSGKTMNRNTSWMCGTCIVPLCIDIVDGNPNSSCFAKWHTCKDLVKENQVLNGELREKRTMKKQRTSATVVVGGGSDGGDNDGSKVTMKEEVVDKENLACSGEDVVVLDAGMMAEERVATIAKASAVFDTMA